jgi:starvation-inducible outer membrane lipoprotein
VAGRIVEVQPTGKGWLIIAQQLPMVEHPAYGPAETVTATPRFAVEYPGKVDPAGLWFGNKVVVLAIAQGNKPVLIDGARHKQPYMVARCMHIWKTGEYGTYGIADYPHTADGYWPLEHQTYCAS